MACPHSYGAQFIEGRRSASTEPSYRGGEVHEVMRAYVKHCGERQVSADWSAFDRIAAAISIEAGRICDDLRNWFQVDCKHIIAVEEDIELDENFRPLDIEDKGRPVPAYRMKPDAIYSLGETEALIDDYKSHPVPFEADTPQSLMYPVGVFQMMPWIETVTFRLVFVRYRNCMRSVTWKRSELPKMMDEMSRYRARQVKMHAIYDAHGLEGLPAIPHAGCHYCPLLQFGECPVQEQNPHAQSAEELTRELVFLEKRRTFVKEILRNEVQARGGPIVVRDDNGTEMSYGVSPQELTAYPAAKVLPIIEKWCAATGDRDFLASVNLSSSTVKDKLNTNKRRSLQHEVESLLRKTTRPKLHLTTANIGEAEPGEEW